MFSDILNINQVLSLKNTFEKGNDLLLIFTILKPYKLGTDILITNDINYDLNKKEKDYI